MRRKQKAIRVVSRPLPQPLDLNFAHRICSVAKSPLKLRSVAQLSSVIQCPVRARAAGKGLIMRGTVSQVP
jgi:hypothetical protein